MQSDWSELDSRSFNVQQNRYPEIRAAMEEILKNVAAAPQDAFEPAKLRCRNVEKVEDENGNEYYRAVIVGADPAAERFQLWLLEELNQRGQPDVMVLTEW